MLPRFFVPKYRWPVDIVLGYHQVNRRKPDPEALLIAMRKAGAEPGDTFHVGDQPEDTEASSRAAGVMAIGAGWGLTDIRDLKESKPDHLSVPVEELRMFPVEVLQLAPPVAFCDTGKARRKVPRYRALIRLNGARSKFHARTGPGGFQNRKSHFQRPCGIIRGNAGWRTAGDHVGEMPDLANEGIT